MCRQVKAYGEGYGNSDIATFNLWWYEVATGTGFWGVWKSKGELRTNSNTTTWLLHIDLAWEGWLYNKVNGRSPGPHIGSTPGTTYLMIAVSAWFFLECQFKNNNGVYGLFFPLFIQNESAFLDPMRKMYILRISDYLLQLIAECQMWKIAQLSCNVKY